MLRVHQHNPTSDARRDRPVFTSSSISEHHPALNSISNLLYLLSCSHLLAPGGTLEND